MDGVPLNCIERAFEYFSRDDGVQLVPFESFTKLRGLGSGAFGEVYAASWNQAYDEDDPDVPPNTVEVAVKQMHRQFVKREDLVNLRGEIKMMHRTSHPNVVQFLGASWDKPPNVCILLELMPGGALEQFIHGGFQHVDYQGKALGIALDVCRGRFSGRLDGCLRTGQQAPACELLR